MQSTNALELPEIAHIIAGYLSDLEACLSVCKAWRCLYLPYYWREVIAGKLSRRKDTPVFLDLTRHGHYRKFVQVLSVYHDYDPIHQSLDYPNLRKLCLVHEERDEWRKLDENPVLKDFVNRHPLLECLDLRNISPLLTDSAWTACVGHPRLKKVVVGLRSSFSDDFWRVCAQLRELEFEHLERPRSWRIPKDLVLPSIRRLQLMAVQAVNVTELLLLIAACPLLEELAWLQEDYYEPPVWERFGRLATQGTWPHLQRLVMLTYAEDEVLAQVIASMHRATKIDVSAIAFGPLSFAAVQRHSSTLQILRIPRAMDSKMTRDVLCSFPRLEQLEAERLDARDIAEGEPWICASLKKLTMRILFSRDEDHLQPMVFERISRLVHLEEFDRGIFNHYFEREHGLVFKLQSGMGVLASLTQLRRLWLDPHVQAMDSDDARWIMDHWKRLETIRGRLNQDISVREQLAVLFSQSGIEVLDNR